MRLRREVSTGSGSDRVTPQAISMFTSINRDPVATAPRTDLITQPTPKILVDSGPNRAYSPKPLGDADDSRTNWAADPARAGDYEYPLGNRCGERACGAGTAGARAGLHHRANDA